MKNILVFEGYEFETDQVKCETYDDREHRGIIFHLPEAKFDFVLNKKIGWARIFINYVEGGFNDLPFNEHTIARLPNNIKVNKIEGK